MYSSCSRSCYHLCIDSVQRNEKSAHVMIWTYFSFLSLTKIDSMHWYDLCSAGCVNPLFFLFCHFLGLSHTSFCLLPSGLGWCFLSLADLPVGLSILPSLPSLTSTPPATGTALCTVQCYPLSSISSPSSHHIRLICPPYTLVCAL